MTRSQNLSLVDVIYRTARRSTEDIQPLLKYLGYDPDGKNLEDLETANEIADCLCRMGSNDFATLLRGNKPVSYAEVVADVAKKLKAPGASKTASVEHNETCILQKLFADALDSMSEEEKRTLFQSMDLNMKDLPLGSGSAILMAALLKQFGGFATYQYALILANMISRALLGSGLSFATNAAITRSVGALLGPIGWIGTGAWLLVDLAGPAFRKTVPSVVHVATLRQTLLNRVSIGVVGDGSAGKDSLMQYAFNLPADIDPIAGSTEEAKAYALGSTRTAEIINYPGFNDYRPAVNRRTDEMLRHTDAFIVVIDVNGGISGGDQALLKKVRTFGKPVLVCLNKWDLIRDAKHATSVRKAALERLGTDVEMVETVFDPHPSLKKPHTGRKAIVGWVCDQLEAAGKSSVAEALARDLG